MARKQNTRKQRTRKQRGAGYQFGPAITQGSINNYGQEVVPYAKYIPDCVAAAKSDTVGYSGPRGLPGLSGGRLKGKQMRRQSGGRYGFVSAEGAALPGPPSLGGLAPTTRIACEGSTPNPLNPGPHTPSTAPPIVSTKPYFVQAGGYAAGPAPTPESITVPTAGYLNRASDWVSSTGSPSLIQIPYEARSMNPACLKTGGGKKKSRISSKQKKKRTMKKRAASRKNTRKIINYRR